MAAVSVAALGASAWAAHLLADLPQTRTISLHNIHTDETVSVEYKKHGKYVSEAMEKVNWVFRDWRKNEATRMDPALIDLLWEMHAELGSKEPINIISGFRSRDTNEMLRKSVGGQASESRHILGKAADVQFPDVPLKQLRYAAMVREKGGVGYYPTSGTPFVHVDTDRVRAWPRLPRFELALLFPNGRTQHQAAEGGSISPEDVQVARSKYRDLAIQVAEFLDMRKGARTSTTLVADAGGFPKLTALKPQPAEQKVAALPPPAPVPAASPEPAAPKLVAEPRAVDRPARLMPRPSDEDRGRLAQLAALAGMPMLVSAPAPAVRPRREETPTQAAALASLTGGAAPMIAASAAETGSAPPVPANPRLAFASQTATDSMLGWSSGWAQSPAFDEDHPEEITYRPFPIAPFLTVSASIDDADLARLVHPDVARTIDMLDQTGSVPPMRLRPTAQLAQLMWAQKFAGDTARAMTQADGRAAASTTAGVAERLVRTEAER